MKKIWIILVMAFCVTSVTKAKEEVIVVKKNNNFVLYYFDASSSLHYRTPQHFENSTFKDLGIPKEAWASMRKKGDVIFSLDAYQTRLDNQELNELLDAAGVMHEKQAAKINFLILLLVLMLVPGIFGLFIFIRHRKLIMRRLGIDSSANEVLMNGALRVGPQVPGKSALV